MKTTSAFLPAPTLSPTFTLGWPGRFWRLVLACGVLAIGARAQSVNINDLTEDPITAMVADSLNPGDNGTITADKATPEKVTFSISVDGRGGGSGVAVLLDPDGKTVSDILEVSVTQKFRGPRMDIPYLSISGTFTSDSDPGGLDLSTLGLPDAMAAAILKMGLVENGQLQDLGSRLIDTTTGKALEIGGLSIKAASDIPEPSSVLLCGGLLAAWAVFGHVRARGSAKALRSSPQSVSGAGQTGRVPSLAQ